MRTKSVVLGVLLVGAGLTSCTAPRPDVTFFANRTSALASPALWCDVDRPSLQVACDASAQHPDAVVQLPLRPGDAVQINVDDDIAEASWWVYVAYTDTKGETQQFRTPLITDGSLSYIVRPPESGAQIQRVEVQTGFVPLADKSFAATRTWVLQGVPAATD